MVFSSVAGGAVDCSDAGIACCGCSSVESCCGACSIDCCDNVVGGSVDSLDRNLIVVDCC